MELELLLEEVVATVVEVTVVVEALAIAHIWPGEPSNIPSLSAVEVTHAPQSVCAKDDAPLNISAIDITPDTSH